MSAPAPALRAAAPAAPGRPQQAPHLVVGGHGEQGQRTVATPATRVGRRRSRRHPRERGSSARSRLGSRRRRLLLGEARVAPGAAPPPPAVRRPAAPGPVPRVLRRPPRCLLPPLQGPGRCRLQHDRRPRPSVVVLLVKLVRRGAGGQKLRQ